MKTASVLPTLAVLLRGATAQNSSGPSGNSSLPVVDLGYELHRAHNFNSTGAYYNFSNIRYAAPPTGENRFRVPQPPANNRSYVQTGDIDRICPQANPAWNAIAGDYVPQFLAGQTEFNASSFNITLPGTTPGVPAITAAQAASGDEAAAISSLIPPVDPRTTEDCLFLDVVVPQDIFESKDRGYGAPVLVWIYGGGYTAGSKLQSGNPAGLLARSESNGAQGVIYVSMNYRLGAFGWLSGPTFQEDGTANAGLYDQRFALQWVQDNIHLFGGDPNRVTVFGESAGGGSIQHQITAYGGSQGKAPFQQAVLQSPGFEPIVSNHQQEQAFQDYLTLLNVSSLEEARKLNTSTLQRANAIQVGLSPYGSFVYGPAIDGDFVPALPGELLLHGQFDDSLRIMVGHNADEGLLFTTPFVNNETAFAANLQNLLPTLRAWPDVVEYIESIYPTDDYSSQIARTAAVLSEVVFTCNTFYLDKAFGNKTYAYEFAIPPALHGQDVPYTYFNEPSASVVSDPIAIALQEYITSFAMDGNPNEAGVPFFNLYQSNATIQVLNVTGIRQTMDATANQRCNWWQKVLYQ